MNKLTKIILTGFSFASVLCINAFAQTNVSGGIFANTTWSLANSPYIVVDTVVVFPNITLTIEPGVVVKFANGKLIEIRQSNIIAEGTSNDSIIFTSNSAIASQGIWHSIHLNQCLSANFNYCRIQYANYGIWDYLGNNINSVKIKNCLFINNNKGYFGQTGGKAAIDTCVFQYNTTGIFGLLYNHINYSRFINNSSCGILALGEGQVTNCTINSNLYGIYDNGGSEISNCRIDSNVQGIVLWNYLTVIHNCSLSYNNIAIYDSSGQINLQNNINHNIVEFNNIGIKTRNHQDLIQCNKICNNNSYGFYNDEIYAINVSNNYWCSSDSATIASYIYDGYDNLSLGLATFMPFDSLQCYLTTSLNEFEKQSFNFKIFPNPTFDYFTLFIPDYNSKSEINIFNVLGELEYSTMIIQPKTYIDVSTLPSGIYIVEIVKENNIRKQKFIKQKNIR